LLASACYGLVANRDALAQWIAGRLGLSQSAEPIALLKLEQGPLQLEIQADGEAVGLESTAVVTPNTGAGSLKLAWLVSEGTMAAPGDELIRYDSTDMLLNLETQRNTLNLNQLQTKIDTGDQQLNEQNMIADQTAAQFDYEYTMTTKPEDPAIFSKWEIINAQLIALQNPFETKKLTLPDFSKASDANQQRRGGPGPDGGDMMRGMGPPPGGGRDR
jgi:hypothetical protein